MPAPGAGESRGAPIPPEVQQVVKAQRRIRGVISCVDQGACKVESTLGVFAFDPRSVKPNKNHPNRKPQVGDPCEFRLSQFRPPAAVSIRVAVPKEKKQTLPVDMDDEKVQQLFQVLERHCANVAPLVAKLDDSEMRLFVAVLLLFAHCQDVVEGAPRISLAVKQVVLRELPIYAATPALLPVEVGRNASCAEFFKNFEALASVLSTYVPDRQRNIILSTLRNRGDGLASYQGKEIMTVKEHSEYMHFVGGLVADGVGKLVDVLIGDGRFNPQKASSNAKSLGGFVAKMTAVRAYVDFATDDSLPVAPPAPAAAATPAAAGAATAASSSASSSSSACAPPAVPPSLSVSAGRASRFPKKVWGYQFDPFGMIVDPNCGRQAVAGLSALLAEALENVSDTIGYLSLLVDHADIFTFMAIPAIAALAHLVQMWEHSSLVGTQTFSASVQLPAQACTSILSIEHPRSAAWWFSKLMTDFTDAIDKPAAAAALSYDAADDARTRVLLEGITCDLRRMDKYVEQHAAPEADPRKGSLTRALVAQQGANIGGQLLYSIVDSLGMVWRGIGGGGGGAGDGNSVESTAGEPSEGSVAAAAPSKQGRHDDGGADRCYTNGSARALSLDSASEAAAPVRSAASQDRESVVPARPLPVTADAQQPPAAAAAATAGAAQPAAKKSKRAKKKAQLQPQQQQQQQPQPQAPLPPPPQQQQQQQQQLLQHP
eukprot:Rhum_TRINITY_DN12324_c0_g1::Rhum_TRINITY_DN12324_c0_g1_i1::g.51051::m.51051